MARAPLLQLSDVSLGYGGAPLFEGLSLVVQPGDRVALVGRNGSGKSTLMKVMAGLVEVDQGVRTLAPSMRVGYMEQDPDFSDYTTLGDFATAPLPEGEEYRAIVAAEGLGLALDTPVSTASGGERRRAALVRLLADAPDLMLLDEPTNHLDINTIQWLEAELRQSRTAFIMISHDRAILENLSRTTLWLDRGRVRRREAGFGDFESWRDQLWAEEDMARHKLDRVIQAESRWAVEGISARRKRNMGRLRALQDMRQERASQVRRQGVAAMGLESGPISGRKVIEARSIDKAFGGQEIVQNLSLRVLRGDRIAFVGPNGAGKTTLIRMLTGGLAPDAGEITLGTNLEIAIFDQNRATLDLEASLWENLTGDRLTRVSGATDQIMCGAHLVM
jgi:ATP-binding cassette subfamily F protein uup